eukprot:CAMPEP_0168775612 /NCGR_PEP_ID=MMETSP0725-20121227/5604_1 /TAXON_ID=265536 /ORGANISM="Amphiprora sp., Strain CCMP467" /LENGTH=479 /DNA_ID=CAMNT_0008825251 /DNA_START=154 /DNA_END=1589 /DNA_ORIENTATION=-
MAPFSNDNNIEPTYPNGEEEEDQMHENENVFRKVETSPTTSSPSDVTSSSSSTTMATEPCSLPQNQGCNFTHSQSQDEVHPQVLNALDALFGAVSSPGDKGRYCLTIGGKCPKTKRWLAVLDQSTALHLVESLSDIQFPLSLRFHCSICPHAKDNGTSQILSLLLQRLSSRQVLQSVEMSSAAFLEQRFNNGATRNHPIGESALENCDLGDGALVKCLACALETANHQFHLTLIGFDWRCARGSSYEAVTQVLREGNASCDALKALEFQECVFPSSCLSLIQSLTHLTDLQEFALQQCHVTDAVASQLMEALLHQTRLHRLCLSRCRGSMGSGFIKSLNQLLRQVALRELVLSEDPAATAPGTSCQMFQSAASKQDFLSTLQYGNDSLIQLNLISSCSGAFIFHRKLQALVKRNRLHQAVRSSLQETATVSLHNGGAASDCHERATTAMAIWTHGLARLATPQKPAFSATYLVLSGLAP